MGATASLALGVLSAGANLIGSQKQAKAVRKAGNLEASFLDENASATDLQAADAIARGAEQEHRFRADVKGLVGTQRANAAASGLALDSGSTLDLQNEAVTLGELDALQIRNNAAREAYGFQVQADSYRRQAGFTRDAARNQSRAIKVQGYTSLLTAGAGMAAQMPTRKRGPRVPRVPRGTSGGYSGGGNAGNV